MNHTILITGATGYLGTAICVDLSRDNSIIGLYRRTLSKRLKNAAPRVQWEKGDVAEPGCLDCILNRSAARGNPVDYIIHFAAFTDFGEKWLDEYSNTNVIGTRNVIESGVDAGVKRIIFAGSIAALEPESEKEVLTEQSFRYGNVAYSKSKAMGEKMLKEHSSRVPAIVLRIGGVFTDWCELPPLFSVMKLWSRPFIGRMMPGKGNSGFPYIHRKDVVRIVRKIVDKEADLRRYEVLFASQNGATTQKQLFPIIRKACGPQLSGSSLHISRTMAKFFLHGNYLLNSLIHRKTYERAWMIRYVDRPLIVDTSYTCSKLDWKPSADLHILTRLPLLMQKFRSQYKRWYQRNIKRNEQKYEYYPD